MNEEINLPAAAVGTGGEELTVGQALDAMASSWAFLHGEAPSNFILST